MALEKLTLEAMTRPMPPVVRLGAVGLALLAAGFGLGRWM